MGRAQALGGGQCLPQGRLGFGAAAVVGQEPTQGRAQLDRHRRVGVDALGLLQCLSHEALPILEPIRPGDEEALVVQTPYDPRVAGGQELAVDRQRASVDLEGFVESLERPEHRRQIVELGRDLGVLASACLHRQRDRLLSVLPGALELAHEERQLTHHAGPVGPGRRIGVAGASKRGVGEAAPHQRVLRTTLGPPADGLSELDRGAGDCDVIPPLRR